MAKKRTDRHKQKQLNFRLPDAIRQQLEALADRNMSSVSEELRRAVRELLEREGLWPPPGK